MRNPLTLLAAVLTACGFALVALDPAAAQRRDDDTEVEGRVFSADVGELVFKGREAEDEGDLVEARRLYDRALNYRGVTPYEKGVTLQLLAQLALSEDDTNGAITFLERAMAEGDLLESERQIIQFNVGQLYLSIEQFRRAIEILESWLASGAEVRSDQIYMNLVYAYVEVDSLRDALRHARNAYNFANPRERKHYDTLNFLFTELNMPRERAELLQEMVQIYPTDKSIWTSIAALYAQGGQESRAFEINKIMYLNGMLVEESEIMRVIDYYSFYEVPYRGAEIMAREMNRGRVERTRRNYEKLARLYRQAREFDDAIEPLTQAAQLADDGNLFRQLGEAFYASGRAAEAERALRQAISKGIPRTGDAWVLIGNTRYERNDREGAITAFAEGAKFAYSRRTAAGWIDFINGELEAEAARIAFENDVAEEEVRVGCERRTATNLIDAPPVFDPRTGEEVDCQLVLTGVPSFPVVEEPTAEDAADAGGAAEDEAAEAE